MTTQAASATESARASYRGVLKSTSLMGGASFIQILIRMIRVKFVAVLLGTSGVGLAGMYGQIINLATTASGMGLQGSGVKHVAESVGTGDAEQVARTAIALKRLVWVTGALGMLVLVVFSRPISVATFGTPEYTVPVAILGVVVFLTAITTGYASILRGHRRIAEIARIQVLGAVAGTVISIPCYYLWGLHGILVALVLGALVMLGINWWRARRVPIQNIHLSWKDTLAEGRGMMSLGVGLMGAALCGVVANYLIRVILIRRFDLSDVGVYQAAFNLSGVLVAFVLGAMAADYFPRLSAVASDNDEVSRVVREQAEIAVTLALPGLVAMMIFAPVIINVFYAEEFLEAVPILRWCVFGVLGRVLSWPLGFVILAKGKGRVFFFTELSGHAMHLAAIVVLTKLLGLPGSGVAFMVMYVYYVTLMYIVVGRSIGSRWQYSHLGLCLYSFAILSALFLNNNYNPSTIWMWIVNGIALVSICMASLRQLSRKSGMSLGAVMSRLRLRPVPGR